MVSESEREREPGRGETARLALLMLAAGITLGVAWNALHLASRPPGGLPWLARAASPPPVIQDVAGPLTLELSTFKRLFDANAVLIVDAREPGQFLEGHIAGAISLPYSGALADPGRIAGLAPEQRPIVVYCSGGTCALAMDLGKFLVESGKRRVLVYTGGYPEWVAAGYPVTRGSPKGAHP